MEISPPSSSVREKTASSEWDRLPSHICEKIFSFLSVSDLLVSKSVCRSWSSVIRSESFVSFSYPASSPARRDQGEDLYFILFAADLGDSPYVAAYRSSRNRWVSFPLSDFSCTRSCCRLRQVHASGDSLILADQYKESLLVYDLFARTGREIAPMISLHFRPYVLGLIEEGPWNYKIVAVATLDQVFSQVYDSKTRAWELRGYFLNQFAVLGNSAYLDGLLYCLSHAPDHLLAFDPAGGDWSLVDVAMPSIVCSHILAHRGFLLLVGGVEEAGEIGRIGIWELDRRGKRWREFGFMPDELLRRFCSHRLYHFYTVDRKGVICFYNTGTNLLLMCDLEGMRWWWPPPCPFQISMDGQTWIGHALEPRIEMVR